MTPHADASTWHRSRTQDLLAQWIDECCESGPSVVDTFASLLASSRNYAKIRGEEPGGSKGFSKALRSRGVRADQRRIPCARARLPRHQGPRAFRTTAGGELMGCAECDDHHRLFR